MKQVNLRQSVSNANEVDTGLRLVLFWLLNYLACMSQVKYYYRCFQSDTKDAGFKMIESSMDFLSNWIVMQQKMGSKTYSSCQSLKSCPGTTTDQSWLTNKSQWRAASGLLFIIFWWNSGLWRREQMPPVNLVERRCCARHQSICQSFNCSWKCLEITRTILTANCGTKRREGIHRWQSIMTTLRIAGQQLMQFDQSLILA